MDEIFEKIPHDPQCKCAEELAPDPLIERVTTAEIMLDMEIAQGILDDNEVDGPPNTLIEWHDLYCAWTVMRHIFTAEEWQLIIDLINKIQRAYEALLTHN